jgi:lysophospholipase L1-like esterase
MCGRTTIYEDPVEGYKCDRDYIILCLQSHTPMDLVLIMLGTNDLKKRFSVLICEIAKGARVLVDLVYKANYPCGYQVHRVLLIAPSPILEVGQFQEMFEGGAKKSLKFGAYYQDIAAVPGCHFMNVGKIISSSPEDGIHI